MRNSSVRLCSTEIGACGVRDVLACKNPSDETRTALVPISVGGIVGWVKPTEVPVKSEERWVSPTLLGLALKDSGADSRGQATVACPSPAELEKGESAKVSSTD